MIAKKFKEGQNPKTNRQNGYPDIFGAVRSKPISVLIYQVP
jgi:hypothetical protein